MSVVNSGTISSICFRMLGQEPAMSHLRQVIQEEDVWDLEKPWLLSVSLL